MEKTHVEITQASNPDAWYRDRIGEVYEVVKTDDLNVPYRAAHRVFGGILAADCKVVQLTA